MEIKFFSKGRVLDLSGQKLSLSESNSKISDKISTKYLFPFEFYMDEKFKSEFGDYSSFDAYDLEKIIDGQFLCEDVYHIAKLEILGHEGNYLTGQIDFGFENVPNFDKPLKDLPFEKFKVDNIHTFAAEVAGKKYPQTNFNFPRLYYGRYTPDNSVWDAYNGFVNDINDTGSALRNNYIDELGNVFNVNIVHPLLHILYILKTGFKDGGCELAGDILTDPFLAQQWVFSGTEYFSKKIQRKYGFNFSSNEYDKTYLKHGPDDYAEYRKDITIKNTGIYKLAGFVGFFKAKKMFATYVIALNGVQIWSKSHGYDNQTIYEQVNLNLEINVTATNSVLEMYVYTQFHPDWSHQMAQLNLTSLVLEDDNPDDSGDDEVGVITNLNEIDLSRAVPDLTFGQVVNNIRNFLNYEVIPAGNIIYMNKISGDKKKPVKVLPDHFLVSEPKRNILNKKSFELKMPEWENNEKPDSLYYDINGIVTNKEGDASTTVIETNTYSIPVYVGKPQGPETGVIKSFGSNLLQLVKYEGKTGIQNNAKPSPELTFPSLFYSNWEPFLRGRLRSSEFIWSFTASQDEIDFTINDELGGYQNIHMIKDWVKDFSENSVTVNITTETVN